VWVDTCCIDKSSSAELSEAINSMFDYYRRSAVCYAFLEDVRVDNLYDSYSLSEARWTSRGWTLQELIAPDIVQFYNRSWKLCGTRVSLASHLNRATNIDADVLRRNRGESLELSRFSIAQRMSWAANRKTTRPEDTAYCLLGLFDVHIPLLYGEGQEKAFFRLQEEIMKHSMDHSILAWRSFKIPPHDRKGLGALASAPSDFALCGDVVWFSVDSEPFEMTNKGLRVTLPVTGDEAVLNCRLDWDFGAPLCLQLVESTDSGSQRVPLYHRRNGFIQKDWEHVRGIPLKTFILARTALSTNQSTYDDYCLWFRFRHVDPALRGTVDQDWRLDEPSTGSWNKPARVLRLKPLESHEKKIYMRVLHQSADHGRGSKPKSPLLVIEKQGVFWGSNKTVYPSFTCGFDNSDGEKPLDKFETVIGEHSFVISTKVAMPSRIMDQLVYEIILEVSHQKVNITKGKSQKKPSPPQPAKPAKK